MRLTFKLSRHIAKANLLTHIKAHGINYGYESIQPRASSSLKTVVIDYSSPNIAKPFHVGHLRSTIIGNFIANLYEKLGWKVIRINYLGDWGTQFGLLVVGFQRYGIEQKLKETPLQHLFEVYVKINEDVQKENKTGSTVSAQQALETFRQIEQGDKNMLSLWQQFRDISLNEYTKIYERLGIHFTHVHSESMYQSEVRTLTKILKEQGKLNIDIEGRAYVEIDNHLGKSEKVILFKSDGTSMYLTRDIAALLDRYDRYKFDRIHYVVENGQEMHFRHLGAIVSQFPGWENRLNDDLHIKFGRIEGMSTRKGNVVFLMDILNRARDMAKSTMLSKNTTKVIDDVDEVAEELGRSAIIVQDLSQKRLKSYKFSWERVLSLQQHNGSFLQYCHARLCSLERNFALTPSDHFNADLLSSNQDAINLMNHLKKYGDSVQDAFKVLEPYIITHYLYHLCALINAAYRTCNIQHADAESGQAFLQMFHASRITLSNGMLLLGLKTLEKI